MVSDKVFNTDGAQKIFSSDFDIISEDHIRVFLDGVVVSRDDYDLINNAAVFFTAPTTGQALTVQVGTTPADILSAPTDAGIVAANIANVNNVGNNIDDVNTVAGDLTNVDIVATNIADVNTVADDITNVNTVATDITNVNAVVANQTNIDAVAGNAANINSAVANATNINAAVANETNINAVVADAPNINIVATNVADVNTVAGIGAAGLAGIVANEANINSVGTDIANVNTTATNIADVNTVAGNIAAVNTVSSNMPKVVKVADDLLEAISEIETVANDLNEATSEIETVAASVGNVDAVGTSITNVNTVATNVANVNTTATNIASVNTVSGTIANVNTVATNVADVNSVAANITNVNAAANNEANINAAVSNATNINNFAETYFTSATAPVSPTSGDLWFDSTAQTMKVYGASGWQNAGSSVNGIENSTEQTATAGQTSFPATYDPGYILVYLNGIRLDTSDYTATDGSNVVLNTGAGAGDTFFAQSFGTFTLADHYSKIASDARYLQLTGGTVTGAITAPDFVGPLNGAIQFTAKNDEGAAITKGQVVYIKGVSGDVPTVGLADANDSAKMPAFGLVLADANNNSEVEIVTFGSLKDTKTDYAGWALGDTLYVSTTAGALTNSAPTGESSLIQNIGKIQRVHATAGIIKAGGAGRSNATPNLDDGNVFIGNASNQAAARALVIGDTTGLQTALDGKEPADATILKDADIGTTVLSPTGDGSGLTGINTDLVSDTTPQLGGSLDLNGNAITGTGAIPAANLTGTLPAIDGGALTNLPAGGLGGIEVFTSSGTWDFSAAGSPSSVFVCVVGGGGSGGASTNVATGGGGSGGAILWQKVATTGDVTVTIGAGGFSVGSNVTGGAGGASSFGAVSAGGGSGGVYNTGGTGIGGVGGTNGSHGGPANVNAGGQGGASLFGGQGGGGTVTARNGQPGKLGGGGGGGRGNGGSFGAGGTGGAGVVLVAY